MSTAAQTSLVNRHREMKCAYELFKQGARLQVVQSLTSLSRSRLVKLYVDINGCSPPKGQLPSSDAWFCQHEANIHASLFWNLFTLIETHATNLSEGELISAAYNAYMREASLHGEELTYTGAGEPIFSITRARTLLRLMRIGGLSVTECNQCQGNFIYSPLNTPSNKHDFFCTLCKLPSHVR